MIPILFDSKATDFTTNGLGRLADAIECTVAEERNGPYEMSLLYPVTGKHYSEIATSSIIAVKASPRAGLQAFRVYKISRPINGRVAISCRHISYQLAYIPVRPFSASTLAGALAGFKTNALEPCPFTLRADWTSGASYTIALPGSIRSWLGGRDGSILDVYGGGEYEWDNYNVMLHKARGADHGVVLRYGKNITDLTQETNIENTITGVLSYWQSEDTRVVLSSPVESPTAANFPFPRTVVMDFTDKFENAPTEAALRALTEAYVSQNRIGIPKVSITVTAVNMADVLEFKDNAAVEDIGLCDTITVQFEKLGVQEKAKIIRTEYDVLRERWNSFDVGEARTSLADTIEDQLQAISIRPTTAQAQRTIDRATGVLNSGLRGHVIINRNAEGWANEILFLDNENIAQAQNVLRINNSGIGFSSNGYSGNFFQSWTHTTAITPETGLVYFDYVQGKVIKWTGTAYGDPEDRDGIMARMVRSGFGLYDGDIDIKWNGQRGIYFKASDQEGTSDTLQIGDFLVMTEGEYGRQIWQSSDEMTGMSGEPAELGQYFLWAGWRSDSEFTFAVEDQGGGGADNVVINGHLIVNSTDIMSEIASLWDAIDSIDTGGGDGPEGGTSGESGGTGPGYQGGE